MNVLRRPRGKDFPLGGALSGPPFVSLLVKVCAPQTDLPDEEELLDANPSKLQTEASARVRKLSDLPPAPGVLVEIWNVLSDQNGSATKLARVLERDAALSAKILKLANSAYFALPQPVSDVRTACVVLGFEMVRSIAIGVASFDALTRQVGRALDLKILWRHSVAVGLYAKEIAPFAQMPAEGAFCTGVLHDVGKLALATVDSAAYAKIIEDAGVAASSATGQSPDDALSALRAAETRFFGVDHAEAGGILAERWKFPKEMTRSLRFHHAPWQDDERHELPWSSLLYVANASAHRFDFGSIPGLGKGSESRPDLRALFRLGIDEEFLESLFLTHDGSSIPTKVEQFCDCVRI